MYSWDKKLDHLVFHYGNLGENLGRKARKLIKLCREWVFSWSVRLERMHKRLDDILYLIRHARLCSRYTRREHWTLHYETAIFVLSSVLWDRAGTAKIFGYDYDSPAKVIKVKFSSSWGQNSLSALSNTLREKIYFRSFLAVDLVNRLWNIFKAYICHDPTQRNKFSLRIYAVQQLDRGQN